MFPRTKRNSPRGFTLVELLVVMAIIAILVAVSASAVTAVIAKARLTKCMSNLRNIGGAMITYAGDNNGCLPESGSVVYHSATASDAAKGSPTIDPTTNKASWTEQIEPYIGTSSPSAVNPIFQCPDWKKVINEGGTAFTDSTNPSKYYSYFNGAHAGATGTTATPVFGPVVLARMHAPSSHIIAGDIAFSQFTLYDADPDDYGGNNPAFVGGTSGLHGGSVNLVFADGHVENVSKGYDNTKMTTHYLGLITSGLGSAYTDTP